MSFTGQSLPINNDEGVNPNSNAKLSISFSQQNNGFQPQIPSKLLSAIKYLPHMDQMVFDKSDKINNTLSLITPPQLIELISTLKYIINSSESSRAFEIFNSYPNLAATAAQALLLMGFIDEEVIKDCMRTNYNFTTFNKPTQLSQASLPPLYNQKTLNQPVSKWSEFPPQTQAKLQLLPQNQANLIAQVLTIPEEQMSTLPLNKQSMIMKLRAQYL